MEADDRRVPPRAPKSLARAMARVGLTLLTLIALISCDDDPQTSPDTGDTGPDVVGDANPDALTDAGPDAVSDADATDAGADLGPCETAAGQPVLEARTRTILTMEVEIETDDGTCLASLQFKDLDGSGAIEPFENWRLTSAERAADLVARLSDEEKAGLLAHPILAEDPGTSTDVDAVIAALVEDDHIRFGMSTDRAADMNVRAEWANELQALAEGLGHGVPFLLSSQASNMVGNGRVLARRFSEVPYELGLGATGNPTVVRSTGQLISEELGAIGIRLYLDVPADLYTDPRRFRGQFTFGEDAGAVSELLAAYIDGLLEASATKLPTAVAVGSFPGAGAAIGGWDDRLEKGRFLVYPGDQLDAHLEPFAAAIEAGAQVVLTSYGIPQTGSWSALDGALDGSTIEQVGASFNGALVTDALRGELGFTGVVLAPPGVLQSAGTDPFGAPWGVESLTPTERLAAAVGAGVDQFLGLDDPSAVTTAISDGDLTQEAVDTAATRLLTLLFDLGLFEDPYVDAEGANSVPSSNLTDARAALSEALVLLVNEDKPEGWLNGEGDGTQVGDKGNAGNGTGRVLPAPPGIPYVTPGCTFFIMGDLDLDYVLTVSAGYGTITNDAPSIGSVLTPTDADRIPRTDYVFIRIPSPAVADSDGTPLGLPSQSLTWEDEDAYLAELAFARQSIEDFEGESNAQIVVGIDGGRLPVLDQILAYEPSAVIVTWMGLQPTNADSDKIFLDLAFGIDDITGTLPVGAPLSDEAMSEQDEDAAGDGQSATFIRGFGFASEGYE